MSACRYVHVSAGACGPVEARGVQPSGAGITAGSEPTDMDAVNPTWVPCKQQVFLNVEPSLQLQTSPCSLRQGLSLSLEFINLMRLAGRGDPGVLPSMLPSADCGHHSALLVLMWVLGIGLRSSCLLGKRFANFAIPQPTPPDCYSHLVSLELSLSGYQTPFPVMGLFQDLFSMFCRWL